MTCLLDSRQLVRHLDQRRTFEGFPPGIRRLGELITADSGSHIRESSALCGCGFADAALHHFPWMLTVACADLPGCMHSACQSVRYSIRRINTFK